MRLLSRLGLRPSERVADAPALGRFLISRTAFVAQKVTVEYCRARAGIGWHQLMSEPDFVAALDSCRWEAFGAVCPDLAETCQILLRDRAAPHEALGEGLSAVVALALAGQPLPSDRTDWSDVTQAVATRLQQALLAAPHAVHRLGGSTVTRILEHVPYHPRIKNADRDILENSLRLGLCGVYAELERQADVPALTAALRELAPATP